MFAQLISDVAELKLIAEQSKETLHDMRDILASFRIVGQVAKWLAAVGAGAAAVWATVKGIKL